MGETIAVGRVAVGSDGAAGWPFGRAAFAAEQELHVCGDRDGPDSFVELARGARHGGNRDRAVRDVHDAGSVGRAIMIGVTEHLQRIQAVSLAADGMVE
ncbi:hypothetical protein Sa4125_17770 [Aureimonas sp. SA4125]|nr:hypothetical protein Sa4125_17770 [Aureimonas sp. SA4125]